MEHIEDILNHSQKPRPTNDAEPAPAEQEPLCPICGGTGYLRRDVPVGHPDFGKLVVCECRLVQQETRRQQELRSISNLDALARFTFANFIPEGCGLTVERQQNLRLAYDAAQGFATRPTGWLVLMGHYGCGKTHLAAAIANQVVGRGELAIFVVVPDLLDHLRATYSPHSTTTYDRRFEEIRNCPLLILDDLGAHSSTPWAQEKLFQIFNHRYNARLPTVITSNHRLEEIDMRIRSRIIDPDLARLVKILAPDFRQSGVGPGGITELSSLPMHGDQTLDNFSLRRRELGREKSENLKRILDHARDFAAAPRNWIVFTGPYGCGKTHLAAAIANAVALRAEPVLFIVVPDLLDHLRATFNPNSLTPYDRRFEEIRSCPLLILDDLGTESATPWAEEKLYQLFNYRYNARLPTVITIAKDVELKPRLKSLIMDLNRCTPLEINVPSYRGRAAHNNK